MRLPDEIFVVVCERDGFKDGQTIVWETYIGEQTTREGALHQAKKLGGRYGQTRIARLVFDEDDHLVEQLESLKEFERHEIGTFDYWF